MEKFCLGIKTSPNLWTWAKAMCPFLKWSGMHNVFFRLALPKDSVLGLEPWTFGKVYAEGTCQRHLTLQNLSIPSAFIQSHVHSSRLHTICKKPKTNNSACLGKFYQSYRQDFPCMVLILHTTDGTGRRD